MTTPPSPTLRITLIQSRLYWEDKTANLTMFEEKINAVKEKMEIVFLPEMFSTGFSMKPQLLAETMDGETVAWMKRISAQKGIILSGSVIIEEGGQYFNRLIWMLPNGQYGYYDKRHLFAYAEEDEHYHAGKKRLIASVKGWKINLQICYDLRFPVWARQSVPLEALPEGGFAKKMDNGVLQPEYDLLVYVANWPEKRSHAWKTLLQARAIENQCYVIGVNRTGVDGNGIEYSGDSMIVDPAGEILEMISGKEAVVGYSLGYERLEGFRKKFPFLRDADPFIIGS